MDINDVRKKINDINDEMLSLFLERMELSKQIAQIKNEKNLPVLDRTREREVLARMTEKAGDMEEYAYYFFQKIMDLSRAYQNNCYSAPTEVRAIVEKALAASETNFPKSAVIACQGTEGSNAQEACDKIFPRGNIVYLKTFRAVFDAVDSGLCRFGVVPIENSTNGSVRAVYELLGEKNFSIVRSTNLCIRHCLLAKPGTKLEDIKTVYSHQQAIGQCSKFLAGLDGVTVVPCENTAVAAKEVSLSQDNTVAAISAPQCAEIYALETVRQDIQDNDNNYTRFICVSKDPVIYAGANRISLIFSCHNKPGALGEILSKLSAHGINMNKLESCPVAGRNFEFIFFIELDASVTDNGVLPMLEDLERTCESFRFLGNYAII